MAEGAMYSQLGDARTGKLADNLSGFGRTLRRAGVRVDAARMALAQQAVMLVGLQREDFGACLLYTSPSPRDQRGSRMPSSA